MVGTVCDDYYHSRFKTGCNEGGNTAAINQTPPQTGCKGGLQTGCVAVCVVVTREPQRPVVARRVRESVAVAAGQPGRRGGGNEQEWEEREGRKKGEVGFSEIQWPLFVA